MGLSVLTTFFHQPLFVSPIKLAQEPLNHPDHQFASNLVHDLQFGCCIGYQGPRHHRIIPNLKSTLFHPGCSH